MWEEDCEYLSYKLIEDDIFGHPRYEYYCSKSRELKITYGVVCVRCYKKRMEEKENGDLRIQ